MRENANDDRVVYNDLNNNCSTFAEDVLRQDPEVNEQVRSRFINIPNRVVDILEKLFEPIFYDDTELGIPHPALTVKYNNEKIGEIPYDLKTGKIQSATDIISIIKDEFNISPLTNV